MDEKQRVQGRCRDSLIRTWPRAFEGISDVKARRWRFLITSLAQAASTATTSISSNCVAVVRGGAKWVGVVQGNITNNRLAVRELNV